MDTWKYHALGTEAVAHLLFFVSGGMQSAKRKRAGDVEGEEPRKRRRVEEVGQES